jgi:hypothetical protein
MNADAVFTDELSETAAGGAFQLMELRPQSDCRNWQRLQGIYLEVQNAARWQTWVLGAYLTSPSQMKSDHEFQPHL